MGLFVICISFYRGEIMNEYNFFDSKEIAGKVLAGELVKEKIVPSCLLAIPRGGIQVAQAVAKEFELPVDVIIAKKLPLPMSPEVAFGAMTEDEIDILNEEMMQVYGISSEKLKEIAQKINTEIKHRIEIYGRYDENMIKDSDVVIIDDGVATGSSLVAAIKKVKSLNPRNLIVAVPVSTKSAYEAISKMVDKFISLIVDDSPYFAVSKFYKNWSDLSEDEILKVLAKYRELYK